MDYEYIGVMESFSFSKSTANTRYLLSFRITPSKTPSIPDMKDSLDGKAKGAIKLP